MLGLVGYLKEILKMQGKLPDKWDENAPKVLEIASAKVSEEGTMSFEEPAVVTEDGVLVLG